MTCVAFVKPFCAIVDKGIGINMESPFANFVVEEVQTDCEEDVLQAKFVPARKMALCIGNENYLHMGKLPTCKNDANDMSVLLQGLQFNVSIGYDLKYQELKELVKQ